MPIHKVSSFLGKWENDHFPKRLHLVGIFFFFPSIFWFPHFAQNNFKSLAKLFELTPQEKKSNFFPPKKSLSGENLPKTKSLGTHIHIVFCGLVTNWLYVQHYY